MPELPGNRVYGPIRGHRTRSTTGEYPRPKASSMSEMESYVTYVATTVKSIVTTKVTTLPPFAVEREMSYR